ncbi:MAG: ABC transporter ATP-binding protein [Bryobacterales bacterium]|nr:ABC transporter ATP-binding protein [Bryobacterales bacterium]
MRESIQTLWPYLWRHRRGMALGLTALVAKDAVAVAIPLLLKSTVDQLTQGSAWALVIRWIALLMVAGLLKGAFQYAMRVVLIGISRDIEYDLRNDLFRHLVTLSPGFYAGQRTGDIMARSTNDLNAVRMMLGPGMMYLTETSLTFVLAVAVMLSFDPGLAALALLPAPFVSFAVIFFGRRIHERFEKIQAMFSGISSRVQENLSGVRMIRAYVQEEAELRRFRDLNEEYIAQNLRLVRIQGVFQPLLEALIGLTFLIVLWAGGLRVLSGDLTLGTFVMFNFYMGMLVWPMIALGWVVNLMQRGTASMHRINELLHEQPSIAAPPVPKALPARTGAIEFDDVSLHYSAGPALSGVSLRIEPGETIAIVGRTGSGKSTLAELIPRLRDPSSGVVRIGGIDVRDLDPADLRRRIGMVPQETFLFSTTIEENIAFGVEDAPPEKVRWAAEVAGLAHDIEGFPAGYRTMVGERGITLSGGQKQRLAIARALIRDPQVLILDDALSSVDTVTEERILTGLRQLLGGRTVILISHRVSTVREAGSIVVLDRGSVVERGTHQELVGAAGYYADLAQRQALEEELETI